MGIGYVLFLFVSWRTTSASGDGKGHAHQGTEKDLQTMGRTCSCYAFLCSAMLCLRVYNIILLELNYENGKGNAHHGTEMDTRTMGRK